MEKHEFRVSVRQGARMTVFFVLFGVLVLILYLFGDSLAEVLLFGTLAVLLAATTVLEWRARTFVTDEELSFFLLGHSWQVRPVRVRWTEVAAIEVLAFGRRRYPVLRLADGTELWMRRPSSSDGEEGFGEAMTVLHRHLAAAQHGRPGPDAEPPAKSPGHRVVVYGAIAVGTLVVVALAGVAWANGGGRYDIAPEVRPCAVVPAGVAERALPGGSAENWMPDTRRWKGSRGERPGELRVSIESHDPTEAARYYDAGRARNEALHVVHPVSGAGGPAHSWGSIEGGRYVGEAWSYAGGYLVKVELQGDDATAEGRAADVVRATVGALR